MQTRKRKMTSSKEVVIDLGEESNGSFDSEASAIADMERDELENHGDFVVSDEDEDYEPSGSSETATTEEDESEKDSIVRTLIAQNEILIAHVKSLDHRIQELLCEKKTQ